MTEAAAANITQHVATALLESEASALNPSFKVGIESERSIIDSVDEIGLPSELLPLPEVGGKNFLAMSSTEELEELDDSPDAPSPGKRADEAGEEASTEVAIQNLGRFETRKKTGSSQPETENEDGASDSSEEIISSSSEEDSTSSVDAGIRSRGVASGSSPETEASNVPVPDSSGLDESETRHGRATDAEHGLSELEKKLGWLVANSMQSEGMRVNWDYVEEKATGKLRSILEKKKVECPKEWEQGRGVQLLVSEHNRKEFGDFVTNCRASDSESASTNTEESKESENEHELNDQEKELGRLLAKSTKPGSEQTIDWAYVIENAGEKLKEYMEKKKGDCPRSVSLEGCWNHVLVRKSVREDFFAFWSNARKAHKAGYYSEAEIEGSAQETVQQSDIRSHKPPGAQYVGVLSDALVELAWLGEESMLAKGTSLKKREKLDWQFIIQNRSAVLKDYMREKGVNGGRGALPRLVPTHQRHPFDELRKEIGKALSLGYRREMACSIASPQQPMQKASTERVQCDETKLTALEAELAWLCEESKLIPIKDGSPRKSIHWHFVFSNASPKLHLLVEERKAKDGSNALSVLVQPSHRNAFRRVRSQRQQKLESGYRRDSIATQLPARIEKQRFCTGDLVKAGWKSDGPGAEMKWHSAKVVGRKKKGEAFSGTRWSYSIHFEDGDDDDNIDEAWVMSKEEYKMGEASNWRGVKHHSDFPPCGDEYAEKRGWFSTDLTGPQIFASLLDAIRARDDALVQKKGNELKDADDLNLPEEWLCSGHGKKTRRKDRHQYISMESSASCGTVATNDYSRTMARGKNCVSSNPQPPDSGDESGNSSLPGHTAPQCDDSGERNDPSTNTCEGTGRTKGWHPFLTGSLDDYENERSQRLEAHQAEQARLRAAFFRQEAERNESFEHKEKKQRREYFARAPEHAA